MAAPVGSVRTRAGTTRLNHDPAWGVFRGMSAHVQAGGSLRTGLATGWLTAGPVLRIALRVAGAGLLLGMAWIHQHLYDLGYSTVPTIGPLFRLNAMLGLIAAIGVLLVPMPWWRAVCALGALLQIGTLAALVQSLTIGAFGFHETLDAPYVPQTFAVEILGFLVLAVGALVRTDRRW